MNEVVAEMYQLHQIGKVILPGVAWGYGSAAVSVGATGNRGESVWLPSGMDTLASRWRELRDVMLRRLENTERNLTETAEAVDMIVVAYVSADEEAARELAAMIPKEPAPPLPAGSRHD